MDPRGLDNTKIMIYNYIVKLYLKLWGCKMSKASAIKEILIYLLNERAKDLVKEANIITDLSRKNIYMSEVAKIKDLADNLEHSK